jgi:hypothetical protein
MIKNNLTKLKEEFLQFDEKESFTRFAILQIIEKYEKLDVIESERKFPEVTNELKLEQLVENEQIDVELVFRCFISESQSIFPMTVWSSIGCGETLDEVKERHQLEYEKNYSKVVLEHIFVDLDKVIELQPDLANVLYINEQPLY